VCCAFAPCSPTSCLVPWSVIDAELIDVERAIDRDSPQSTAVDLGTTIDLVTQIR
jgi:hypothetical protein